jgi:hypothetical protein
MRILLPGSQCCDYCRGGLVVHFQFGDPGINPRFLQGYLSHAPGRRQSV